MSGGQRFAGRTALVTGAASGIGRATAIALANDGAIVLACDRDASGLDGTSAEATGEIRAIAADLSAGSGIGTVIDAATDVDIVVNVAGLFDSFIPVDAIDDDLWDRIVAVNLSAPMRLIRGILPQMLERGSGSIVNIASVAGLCGAGGGAAYTATKHGLVGLTRHVAAMYAERGIRCNAVCPAGVATNLGTNSPPLAEPWVLERIQSISLKRVWRTAEADEIAALVCFLCSDEARNINGAAIASDGGWSAI